MGECAAGQAQGTLPQGDRPRTGHPQEHRPQVRLGRKPATEEHQKSSNETTAWDRSTHLNGHFRRPVRRTFSLDNNRRSPEPTWANPWVPHPVTEVPPPLLFTPAKGEMTGPSTRSKVSEGGNPEMPMIRTVLVPNASGFRVKPGMTRWGQERYINPELSRCQAFLDSGFGQS